jgi:hypothetical protein
VKSSIWLHRVQKVGVAQTLFLHPNRSRRSEVIGFADPQVAGHFGSGKGGDQVHYHQMGNVDLSNPTFQVVPPRSSTCRNNRQQIWQELGNCVTSLGRA